MNQQPSKVTLFVGEVLPLDSPIIHGLPQGIDGVRFRNSLATAVMLNPELLKCHPSLVMREVSRAGTLGLSLDPTLGDAYLITRKNRNLNRLEPQLQIGWRGLIRLARQSGDIVHAHAFAVHANDRFSVALGANLALVHEPDIFSDRGPVIGFYAVMRFTDGSYDFEAMGIAEIEKVRASSDGWRAFKAGRTKSTPWSEWPDEMGRKTVLRRLLKRAPMSADALQVLRREDEPDDDRDSATLTPQPLPPAPRRGRPRKDANQIHHAPVIATEDDIDDDQSNATGEGEDEPERVPDLDDAPEPMEGAAIDFVPEPDDGGPLKEESHVGKLARSINALANEDDLLGRPQKARTKKPLDDVSHPEDESQVGVENDDDDGWPGPKRARARK